MDGKQNRKVDPEKRERSGLSDIENFYKLMLENSSQWFYWQTLDNELKFISPNCLSFTGYSQAEFLQNPDLLNKIVHPEDNKKWKIFSGELTGKSNGSLIELRLITKDNDICWIRRRCIAFSPAKNGIKGILCENTVINEEKLVEQQYLQAQKMEAMGRLASGIAHDFSNLLTIIQGYSEMLSQNLEEDDRNLKLVEQICGASDRADSLIKQMLAFSRRKNAQAGNIQINEIIRDLRKMLIRLIGEDITLSCDLGEDIPQIFMDPGQLEQVIMNLVINSRDASEAGSTISIETKSCKNDKEILTWQPMPETDHFAVLIVRDTGSGIEPDDLKKIFDPFYTTKSVDKGTGLGLATVKHIIERNKGRIDVSSKPGEGTVFRIYLPAAKITQKNDKENDHPNEYIKGIEKVIVVEDEGQVRRLMCRGLKRLGYSVIEAENGKSVLEHVKKFGSQIRLLIADVVMPEMSGPELLEEVLKINSGLKVLFISGYSDETIRRQGVFDLPADFLRKPFTPAQLACKVRELIDK